MIYFYIFTPILIVLIIFIFLIRISIKKSKENKENNQHAHKPLKIISEKELQGIIGEKAVYNTLSKLNYKKYILNDFYILKPNRNTNEIDHILITSKGIFVIETKSINGIIKGKKEDNYWESYYDNLTLKNKFYNPIKQNNSHVYSLRKLLDNETDIYSIVVFVQNNKPNISKEVINLNELEEYIEFNFYNVLAMNI